MVQTERLQSEPNKEVLKSPDSICIVTATYYPKFNLSIDADQILEKINKLNRKRVDLGEDRVKGFEQEVSDIIRGREALKTFSKASDLGIKVVLIDGGSSSEFIELVREDKNIILKSQASNGYGPARREGLHLGRDYLSQDNEGIFFMIEPEKGELLEDTTVNNLTRPIREGIAEMIIPNRGFEVRDDVINDSGLWGQNYEGEEYKGYPPYQVHSEVWLNRHLKEKMIECGFVNPDNPTLDALNGTRVFRNSTTVVSQLMNHYSTENELVDSDFYFSSVYALFLSMGSIGKGGRIVSVPVNFDYPKLQALLESSSPEFKTKRDKQRSTITNAIDLWVESYLKHSARTNEYQPPEDMSWFGFEKETRFEYRNFPQYLRNRIGVSIQSNEGLETVNFPKTIVIGKEKIEKPVRYNLVADDKDHLLLRGTGKEVEVIAEFMRLDTRTARPRIIITQHAVMDDIRILFQIASDYIELTDGRKIRFMLPHGSFLPKDIIEEHGDLMETDAIHVSYYNSIKH